MDIVLGLLQLLSICFIILIEHRKRSVSLFLWGMLFLMFGLPHFVAVLLRMYDYPVRIMNDASLFVILFNTIYLVCRTPFPIRAREVRRVEATASCSHERNLARALFLSLLTSLALMVLFSIIAFGGIGNASYGRFYTHPHSPYEFGLGLMTIAANYLLFGSGGIILQFLQARQRGYALVACISVGFFAVLTGNRITILPLLVSIIWWYVSTHRTGLAKQVVILGIAAFVAVYVVYGLRTLRSYALHQVLEVLRFNVFNERILRSLMTGDGELGLREVFYYFLYRNNEFPGFGEGRTYIRLLLIALPTGLSGGLKPPDFAITMGSAKIGDFSNTTYSTHPTLYGDCYANLSWYGVLLAVFWALFVTLIDRVLSKHSAVMRNAQSVLFGCMYAIIGRGSVYNGCMYGLVCGIWLTVMNHVTSFAARVRFGRVVLGRNR